MPNGLSFLLNNQDTQRGLERGAEINPKGRDVPFQLVVAIS
jgi:hypothetical protein